jgi:hypothetical protein
MAQIVECLPSKCKALSSEFKPQYTHTHNFQALQEGITLEISPVLSLPLTGNISLLSFGLMIILALHSPRRKLLCKVTMISN